MSEAALAISLFFHIAATVIWIGGILLITFMVVPELNRVLAEQPALFQLLRRLRERFTVLGNLALAILVVTGVLQMSTDPNYEGLLSFSNRWSQVLLLKHILIIALAALGLMLQFGPGAGAGTDEPAAGTGCRRCRRVADAARKGTKADAADCALGRCDSGGERLANGDLTSKQTGGTEFFRSYKSCRGEQY